MNILKMAGAKRASHKRAAFLLFETEFTEDQAQN